MVELWAQSVEGFSSQYNTDPAGWAAAAALGPPQVYPQHGDIRGTWAQGSITQNEYITLKYAYPVRVQTIEVYETLNAGAVCKVTIQDKTSDLWHTLYQTEAKHITNSRCLKIQAKDNNYLTDTVMLTLDCTKAGSWCEIDAVKLIGDPSNTSAPQKGPELELWAQEVVDFSSQYNSDRNGWAATAALGPPNVYPRHGDIRGAWAQGSGCFGENEYLVLKYAEPMFVNRVEIYETLNAGAVCKVTAKRGSNDWVTLYEAQAKLITSARLLKIDKKTDFKTDTLRVQLDCRAAKTWCEIDAVKLVGVVSAVSRQPDVNRGPPLSKLSEDMAHLLYSTKFTDVTFIVDGKEIKAHRGILAIRSEFFRNIFEANPNKPHGEVIKMGNFGYDAFFIILQYLYSNRVLSEYSALEYVEVIRAATWNKIMDVEQMAMHRLSKMITADNVLDIYHAASSRDPNLPKVEEMCEPVIMSDFKNITKSDKFKQLKQESMVRLIQLGTANM